MEFRSPRARQLWDKWRYVWMLAWERQRRLHDHLMYLHDLERVRRFSWDEWRKRVSFPRISIILLPYSHCSPLELFVVAVLEIHESQEISINRLVPQNGQR